MFAVIFLFFACSQNTTAPSSGGGSNTSGGSSTCSTELSGLQIFPADNPWNTDISSYSLHPNSANFITSIGADDNFHMDFGTVWQGRPIGIPFCVIDGNQALVEVTFEYADESDPGPYPIPENVPIEGGENSDGDRHVILIDRDNNMLYELYAAYPEGGGWRAGSGAKWDLTSNDLRPKYWTSADAAGLPIFPGLVRYDEVASGAISHALRFTVSRTQRAFIFPARHYASSSTDPNLPPMGLRLRLKASYDISAFSPTNQVILNALKKYGMILADNGSDWYISGAPDSRWDDDELHEMDVLTGSDFEVIYTGPIEN